MLTMQRSDAPGWTALTEWFGCRPNFKDAEIVSLDLRRDPEPSVLRVHITRSIAGAAPADRSEEATARFTLKGISEMQLDDWNCRNVLVELSVDPIPTGYAIHLSSVCGLDGEICAEAVSVTIEAG